MTRHTDPEMNTALEADAAKIEAMGGDPGPTFEDLGLIPPEFRAAIDAEIAGDPFLRNLRAEDGDWLFDVDGKP